MLSIFFIGIALSMDAFSVALSLGINNINKNRMIILPLIVSIMHFIMPLIGYFLGTKIQYIININSKLVMVMTLLYLSLIMYKDRKSSKKIKIEKYFNIILYAFSVSLDSFTIGLSLNALTNKILIPPLIFALCSGTITYMGLLLGKYSKKIWQEKSIYIGIALLLIISLVNICQLIVELFD